MFILEEYMRKQIQILGFLILSGILSLNTAGLKAQTTRATQQTLTQLSDINLKQIHLSHTNAPPANQMAKPGFPQKMSTATLADGRTEIIFQEWNESAWQNTQRMVLAAGYEYDSVSRFLSAYDREHPASMGYAFNLFPCPFGTDFSWLLQTWQNNVWTNTSRLHVDEDSQGNMAAVNIDTWIQSAWTLSTRFVLTYQDNQLLAEMTFQTQLDTLDEMSNYSHLTYTYNDDNRLSEQLISFLNDSTWTDLIKRIISYDANGYLDTDLMQMNIGIDDGNPFMNFVLIDDDYNATGQILGRTMQGLDFALMDGTMKNIWKKIWTWDGAHIIEEHVKQWHETVWVDSLYEQATYDDDQCTYWLIQTYQDGWVNQFQGMLTETPGVMLEEIQQQWETDAWVNTDKTQYSYEDEKLVQILNQSWDDAWINVSRQSYNNDLQTTVDDNNGPRPEGFSLGNYPNPFNPSTTIYYTLATPATVKLAVYDIKGQHVRTLIADMPKNRGTHNTLWDGRDNAGKTVPSGVYLYQLKAGKRVKTGRCLLLK